MKNLRFQHLFPVLILISILFITFWIRMQSADILPDGQFLENDGYFYYWQANTIIEQGKFPPRDINRWMPLGRDNNLLLSLYPYMLANTYKAVHLFFKDVSLYHVCLYIPTVCFVLSLAILCVLLYRIFGAFVANTIGILIATFPGTIGRSTVGFGDRDCWILLLAISAITVYLIALQTQNSRKRIILTILSGFLTLLGDFRGRDLVHSFLSFMQLRFGGFLLQKAKQTCGIICYGCVPLFLRFTSSLLPTVKERVLQNTLLHLY